MEINSSSGPMFITANDPSQGDITSNVKMFSDVDQTLPGIYYEEYSAMDASGNEAIEVLRVVYVVADQTAPVITVTGAADTTIEVGTAWVDLPAVAIDNSVKKRLKARAIVQTIMTV